MAYINGKKVISKILNQTSNSDTSIEGVTVNGGTLTIRDNIKQTSIDLYANNKYVGLYGDTKLVYYSGNITSQDGNLTAENILHGKTILGVTGNAFKGVTTETIDYYPTIVLGSETEVNHIATAGAKNIKVNGANSSVYINSDNIQVDLLRGSIKATNLSAENIKKGVNILGITGALETTGNTIIDGAINGITEDAVDEMLIINGYTNYDEINIMDANKYITIQGNNSTIKLSNNVNAELYGGTLNIKSNYGGVVTATNLDPANIKKGVTILGVTGTYEG